MKLENYDISKINKYKRQQKNYIDFEKTNSKSATKCDDSKLSLFLEKDSVQQRNEHKEDKC